MNDQEYSSELLSLRSGSAKLPGTMNIAMIVALIIAALASLGELAITPNGVVNISLFAVIIYIIASMVYRSNYSIGILEGKKTEEYTEAKAEYDAVIKEIYERGIHTELPEYCFKYCEQTLRNARAAILGDYCISYDTYADEYMGKSEEELRTKGLSSEEIKCVLRANKTFGIHLTSSMLITPGEDVTVLEKILGRFLGLRHGLGISSSTRQRIDFGSNMISRAITTLLTGAVTINVALEPSLETVALWGVKMLPVVVAALTARNSGTKNVLETLIPQLKRKTAILRSFVAQNPVSDEK